MMYYRHVMMAQLLELHNYYSLGDTETAKCAL